MDAEGPVDKQTSQPSAVETALSTVRVDPTFTPPPSSALRKGLPETAQGCSAQLEPLPSPCQLPRPQKDREGLRGGSLPGLWPWTHAQAWQGPCFLPLPSATRVTSWLGGGLSTLP